MTKYISIFMLLTLLFACDTTSNTPSPGKNYFIKYFGGDGNQTAVDLILNNDGTFFILGNSIRSAGANQRVYLAKADAQGRLIWQKTYGDPTTVMNARDLELTSDGTLAVVANKLSSANNMDVLLSRFTQDGNAIDSVLLQIESLPSPKNEYANSLTELSDGGFLIIGYTNYSTNLSHQFDELHFRTDKSLRQLLTVTDAWAETTGSGIINIGVKAFQTNSNNIYVFGSTSASTTINSTSLNFWNFGLGQTGYPTNNSDNATEFIVKGSDETITNVVKSPASGYVLSGILTDSITKSMTLYLKRTRFDELSFNLSDIAFNYNATTSSVGTFLGKGAKAFATAYAGVHGGYYVVANTYANSDLGDILLIRLDDSFQAVWSDPVILGGDGEDTAAAVAELPDGHVIVLGTMSIGSPSEQNKIVLMKLNSSGKLAE